MDCRTSLLLAFSLASTSLGCLGPINLLKPKEDAPKVETAKVEAAKAEAPPEGTPITPAANLPRRTPKAATCVAFGNFRANEAANPKLDPVQQQFFRDQARKAYLQALKIDRKCLPAYSGLASLYSAQGDPGKAQETFEKALKVFPKEASLWFELGMCCSRQKQWDPAIEKLRKAARLAPENRHYATTLAFTLARSGKFSDSIDVFTPLVGIAEAHYRVARMAHHMRQEEQCKELLRLALKDKPDLAAAQQLLDQLEGRAPANPVATAGFEEREGTVPPGGAERVNYVTGH
jgi:tetratricopeptide (TPR) repeat protein